MSLSVKTNLSSLLTYESLNNSSILLGKITEQMATGFKINHASDNAANFHISTNMSTKISAYEVAEENVRMGLDMVMTAADSLSLMSDMTSRLRALAVQAHNGTYGNKSLDALNKEAQSLLTEIYRIRETASYNGIKLFNDFNSTAPTSTTGSKLIPNEKGFLKEIAERDTSAMDKLEDVDSTTTLTGGTYSISTVEGLVKLQQMANAKKITGSCEFVLAADIDISKYCKSKLNEKGIGGWEPINNAGSSVLDGNGHVISGLFINRPKDNGQGFIGNQESIKVKNLGLVNPDVTGYNCVGALRGAAYYKNPDNCYVEGGSVSGNSMVGGLVGFLNYSSASYCYTTCNVSGTSEVGGISGNATSINDSFASGDISDDTSTGGIAGTLGNSYMNNCAVYGTVNGNSKTGIFVGNNRSSLLTISDSVYNTNVNSALNVVGTTNAVKLNNVTGVNFGAKVNLQVGINSTVNSNIQFEAWFALDGLSKLQKTRLENDDTLELIDNLMLQITKKQTEYGSVQNRLESALDEISTQYENLVSSRSTLRDADIADVSSEYIKVQILQQASATLLSTANQTPALALQLL